MDEDEEAAPVDLELAEELRGQSVRKIAKLADGEQVRPRSHAEGLPSRAMGGPCPRAACICCSCGVC